MGGTEGHELGVSEGRIWDSSGLGIGGSLLFWGELGIWEGLGGSGGSEGLGGHLGVKRPRRNLGIGSLGRAEGQIWG